MLPAKTSASWKVAKPSSQPPREQWESWSSALRCDSLEHLWPTEEQPQPWLKECAWWPLQLAEWCIYNIQNIMHAAKCFHKIHLGCAQSSVWGQDMYVPQGQRSPTGTRQRTVFPRGLARAVQAETAQREHIKAPGEEMTTTQISRSEDEPVRMYKLWMWANPELMWQT